MRLTSEPKSVCAPNAVFLSSNPLGPGGVLIHLASLQLGSHMGCFFAKVPLGNPSLSLNTSMKVSLISTDFCTKGLMVDSMRVFTVEGYSMCTLLGQARASSLEMLRNSVLSNVPRSSTALAPLALYLSENFQGNRFVWWIERDAYPNETFSLFGTNFIFSSKGSPIVSAPISNISSTSASTPWFFKLETGVRVSTVLQKRRQYWTYYQNPSFVAASQSRSISSGFPCLIS